MTQKLFSAPLAALLLAALFVAGCGGGGGDGGKNDMIATLEADVAMLQADLAALAAAKSAAERARQAAEAAQADAEAARAEAEAAKEAAEMARNEANTAAGAAEARALDAEQKRQAAETARDDAITARDAALMAQQTAEDARDAALADKKTAEDELAAANNQATADLAALRQQLATANTNLQTAQDNLDDANDDLQDANDALTQARTDLATRTRERDTALQERNQAREALARAQGELEGLRASLTQAQQDAAEAERRRREAEAEAQRKIDEAEQQADVSVRAPNLLAKLVALAATTEQAGVTVSYAPGERSVTFRPDTQATRGTAAPNVPGTWSHRASFSSTVGVAATDTFYLYSNIESPAKRKFWQVYGVNEDISAGTNTTLARLTGGRQLRITDDNDTPNDRTDDDFTVTYGGRFDGAGGTFTCSQTNANSTTGCTLANAAVVADGLTITDGTWTFAPSNLSNRVGADIQDDTFLYFGIWAREPKNASDTTNLDFRWIADGDTGDITAANFSDLEGTATFSGGAVGKYALKAVAGRAAKIGTFTAKATMTASFGTAPTLSGTIEEFKEGGNSLGAGWRISLINNATTTAATLSASGASGEAHGSIGGVAAEGDWAVTLHGSDNEILSPRDGATITYPKSQYPAANLAGVVGWFSAFDGADAAGSNAALAGAFGAACTTGAACGK